MFPIVIDIFLTELFRPRHPYSRFRFPDRQSRFRSCSSMKNKVTKVLEGFSTTFIPTCTHGGLTSSSSSPTSFPSYFFMFFFHFFFPLSPRSPCKMQWIRHCWRTGARPAGAGCGRACIMCVSRIGGPNGWSSRTMAYPKNGTQLV